MPPDKDIQPEFARTVELLTIAREVSDVEIPEGLEDRVMSAVRRAAEAEEDGEGRAPSPKRRGGWRRSITLPRIATAGAAALAIAVAVFAGTRIGDEEGPEPLPGNLEIAGTMTAPDAGEETGEVSVRMLGIGRVIRFDSNDLDILPTGEFYELWFVGPGDSLDSPNRISAGTFHPDMQGRSRVEFTAAVDPAKYPILSVTAEPGDGDPARTGPEVLRLDATGRVESP